MAHERIESNPEVMRGKPVIKGTRITVEQIVRDSMRGMTATEIAYQYPRLTRQDVMAAKAYAAEGNLLR